MVGATGLARLRPQVYNADYYAPDSNPRKRIPPIRPTSTPWTTRRFGMIDAEFATHREALDFALSNWVAE
jgi:hypothetical protein